MSGDPQPSAGVPAYRREVSLDGGGSAQRGGGSGLEGGYYIVGLYAD